MIKLGYLFACALVIIAFVQMTNADISCYVCNGVSDPQCADPYTAPNSHLVQCESDYSFCRKTVQSGKFLSRRTLLLRFFASPLKIKLHG